MTISRSIQTFAFARIALAALLATGLAACAGTGGSRAAKTADPAVLEELSTQRWQHLLAGEFAQAWDYFSPGYQATKPRERYAAEMKDRPVKWTKVEYVGQECAAPDSCKVRVKVGFRVRMAVTGVGWVDADRVVTESWIFLDGKWVYLPPEAVR